MPTDTCFSGRCQMDGADRRKHMPSGPDELGPTRDSLFFLADLQLIEGRRTVGRDGEVYQRVESCEGRQQEAPCFVRSKAPFARSRIGYAIDISPRHCSSVVVVSSRASSRAEHRVFAHGLLLVAMLGRTKQAAYPDRYDDDELCLSISKGCRRCHKAELRGLRSPKQGHASASLGSPSCSLPQASVFSLKQTLSLRELSLRKRARHLGRLTGATCLLIPSSHGQA